VNTGCADGCPHCYCAAALAKWSAMAIAVLLLLFVLLDLQRRLKKLPRLPNGQPDWRAYLKTLRK
jgi:hypothetical protein